jgi:hypothetical protein
MTTTVGLLFLLGGVALFVLGILLITARERTTIGPTKSVHRFARSSRALGKIHRVQTSLRDASRAQARAMHPSGRRRKHRKSA